MSEGDAPTQVALVTGASRGIGAAIALELARQGMLVVGTGTTVDGVARVERMLAPFEGSTGRLLDVNDAAGIDALVADIVRRHGGLQVLVNNAGIVFRMCRAIMRPMMKQRYGRIVNITSVVGASGNPGQANYAAAKAGVAGMTRALARELGSRNITVNCVAPGFIETDMTAALGADQHKALLSQIPLGHLGKPADVAHAVAFLASPQAGYVTGQELHVNGGMYM
jgi:3-oxoacyl-[acyl-carrier protein] reductase